MKRINCNHKNKAIHLYPDFSSTGVWCECGISFGDPKEDFPSIPEGVFELVQLWNNYWDDVCFRDHPSYSDGVSDKVVKRHQDRINIMGRELSKIISKYHPCLFVENNAKIFFTKGI